MKLAMLGLGRMGGNMARRLRRGGIEVVGYNRTYAVAETLQREEGVEAVDSIAAAVAVLPSPRRVWLMLPAGEATEAALTELKGLLAGGDVVIDGGNANYHDSMRRAAELAELGVGFIDAGTSGGVWGLAEGYCMMVGGAPEHVALIEPALKVLAPAAERGWAHVGPCGAGHFTKMVHNGIEYGMMQAFAEGLSLLRNKPGFDLDVAQISELWRHGSVVRSWLLDLTAEALARDSALEAIEPFVADSGEGRWTAIEAIDQGIPAPVMTLALQMRFASQGKGDYGDKLLATMRNAFGGHAMKQSD